MDKLQTIQLHIFGIVQAVGFRPTAYRHAISCDINGTVCNKGSYVEIIAQGSEENLSRFLYKLENEAPERAVILKIDTRDISDKVSDTVNKIQTDAAGIDGSDIVPIYSEFSIIDSQFEKGNIFASPDIAVCDKCSQELYDKSNRRYLHPFINCTCCGPRLTILDDMPYDRIRTSMGEFEMCPECGAEYKACDDRRYDAQPVCCPNCGPRVHLLSARKQAEGQVEKAAILKARETIAEGGIVAVKGIGGYHLCCDATNDEAVARLRNSKLRPTKPFALMMRNIEAIEKYCHVSPEERVLLMGHQKPIVLLRKKDGCSATSQAPTISDLIAPNNSKLGVMLPYAPIQLLLFDFPVDPAKEDTIQVNFIQENSAQENSAQENSIQENSIQDNHAQKAFPDALVMTSANASGAPICRTEEDALAELSELCDYILSNNRDIRLRADDSVVDFYKNEPYMIRRSRGFAPLPFVVDAADDSCVLAIGGELKNSFCIRKGKLAYISPYLGDVEDVRTARALEESIERMCRLLQAEPQRIVCDLHPGYATTAIAKKLAAKKGVLLLQVQHHYAHVLSCMAENNYTKAEPVIGVAFDGTGYGTDGSIWGGEFLIADYNGFSRAAHIEPFTQVGGDAAAKEGWRIALSLLLDQTSSEEEFLGEASRLNLCTPEAAKLHLAAIKAKLNCVTSTSVGRLFDARSAILGLCKESTHEGEAAMALQYAAETGHEKAYAFHEELADFILDTCNKIRLERGLFTVALTGGVFQNTLLLSLAEERLQKFGFAVLRHHLCPPNDGGICFGQSMYSFKTIS